MLRMTLAKTSRERLTSLASVLIPASIGITLLIWIIIGLLSAIILNAKVSSIEIPKNVAGLASKPLAITETLVRNPSMPSKLNAEVEVVIFP